MLTVQCQNKQSAREGIEAGRTLADALTELEGIASGADDPGAAIAEMRDWYERMAVA